MNIPILITAPEIYAKRFCNALRNASDKEVEFETIEKPLIETIANPKLDDWVETIKEYDYIAFTSRNAIVALDESCKRRSITPPTTTHYCAIGKDNDALTTIGVEPCFISEEPSPMGIVEELKKRFNNKANHIAVLGPKVEGLTEPDTVPNFIKALKDMGMHVDFVAAYTTRRAEESTLCDVKTLLNEGHVRCVAFSSATEAQVFSSIIKNDNSKLSSITIAALGPYTAQCIRNEGMNVDFISQNFSSFEDFGYNLRKYFMTFAEY